MSEAKSKETQRKMRKRETGKDGGRDTRKEEEEEVKEGRKKEGRKKEEREKTEEERKEVVGKEGRREGGSGETSNF